MIAMITVILLVGSATADTIPPVISQDDAWNAVLSDVLSGDTEGVWIYAYPDTVEAGTTIDTWYGKISLPSEAGWLFFIDDRPMKSWAHPCRYVYVDMTGTISVLDAYGPPEDLIAWDRVAGSIPQKEMFALPAQTVVVRVSDAPTALDALPPCIQTDHCYAVIISGGGSKWSNWPRYWGDVSFIYTTLVEEYGYQDDHIYVLMSDGTDPGEDRHIQTDPDPDNPPVIEELYDSSPLDLDGDGDDDVSYSATKANITTVFNALSPILGEGDTLFIFTTDHGGPDGAGIPGEDVILNLWYESIKDDEFATEVDKISADVPIMITMEQCFSGGFIDDIIPGLAGQKRTIATAANASESSYGDYFSTLWISAVAGHDKSDNPVDADVDDDGNVTMWEAFTYAKTNDPASEHPQFGETPAGVGSILTLCSCHAPILPVADAGEDVTVEQATLAGTTVSLDGTGSHDPCGEVLTYRWTWDGGSASGSNLIMTFPLGTTVMTLQVTADGRVSEEDMVYVTVEDTTPPVLSVPADVTVEQETLAGTEVPLVATATDICDASPVVTSDAPDIFPLGTTTVTFTAEDASGNTATGTTYVTVVDTTPPEISVTVAPDRLWPVNHKLTEITATVIATDICDASPVVELQSITSNQPDNDIGDGNTVDDIVVSDVSDFTIWLRAERCGNAGERIYTITYVATDASGNSATAEATVTVPHSKK